MLGLLLPGFGNRLGLNLRGGVRLVGGIKSHIGNSYAGSYVGSRSFGCHADRTPHSIITDLNPSSSQSHFNTYRSLHYSTKLGRPKKSDQQHLQPPSQNPPLRDYQQDCINECLITIHKGYRRFCVSLPTGSGKTRTFYGLLDAIAKEQHPDKKKWLILAHREELITQAYNQAKRLFPNSIVEVEMGKKKASSDADIIIASVQSIARDDRLKRFNGDEIGCVIIDEAHHAPAASYRKILDHLGVNHEDSKTIVAGFSATLSRMDGLALGSTFDYIAYHKDLSEMIQNGYLTNIKFTTISTEVDLANVKQSRGDFVPKSLSRIVDSPYLNELVYKAWKSQTNSTNTLIFGVNIEHVGNLAKSFRDNGVDAHVVTSDTPNELRRNLIEDFKQGEIPVLINCGIFTEGTDIPNIDTVMLVRPTRSPGLLMQMIGRGLRLYPGKDVCHIIDMFGSSSNVNGLATVPTLAGLDPELVKKVEKEELEDGEKSPLPPKISSENPKQIYIEDFDNIDEFINKNKSDYTNIISINRSQLNWINSGNDNFLLFAKDGYIRLCPDKSSGYSLVRFYDNPFKDPTIKSSKTPGKHYSKYLSKSIFTNLPDFNSALNAADIYARQNFSYHLIAKKIPWRNQPHTPSQEKIVFKIFKKLIPDEDIEATDRVLSTVKSLTKGECANLINLSSIGNKSGFKSMIYPKQPKQKKSKPFTTIQPGPIRLQNRVST